MLPNSNEATVSRRYVLVVGPRSAGKKKFINSHAPSPLRSVATTRMEVAQPIAESNVILVEGPGFGIDIHENDEIHKNLATWMLQTSQANDEICAVIFILSVSETSNYEYSLSNFEKVRNVARSIGVSRIALISNKGNIADPEARDFWSERYHEDSSRWWVLDGSLPFLALHYNGDSTQAKIIFHRILNESGNTSVESGDQEICLRQS